MDQTGRSAAKDGCGLDWQDEGRTKTGLSKRLFDSTFQTLKLTVADSRL